MPFKEFCWSQHAKSVLNALITLRGRALNKAWEIMVVFVVFVFQEICHLNLCTVCNCKEDCKVASVTYS